MTKADWEMLNHLFDEAIAKAPEEREEFLARTCQDKSLRIQVASLISAYDEADEVLQPLDELVEASSRPGLSAGTYVGHFCIVEEIGRGGMGIVYKAEDTKLQRLVALKFLPAHYQFTLNTKERFLNEARAASALDHPNLCTIYEVGEHDGHVFIAMALYDGETLKEKIDRGPLPVQLALDFVRQITDGLAGAHAKGIIHRDIKPANIIITPEGRAKILDFGLAKVAERSQELTGQGIALGTVAYMSPEQTQGEEIGTATDMWSLGILFYEMLAGKRPFRSASQSVLVEAIRNEHPTSITQVRDEVPNGIDGILDSLLAKNPASRITAVRTQDALNHLEDVGQHGSIISAIVKRPVVLVGISVAVIALLFGILKPMIQENQIARASMMIPEIQQLAQNGKFAEAYALAEEAEKHLEADPALNALWPLIADQLTITTSPAGASVSAQRYRENSDAAETASEFLGHTPIEGRRVPRGAYRLLIEKEGYANVERLASRHLFEPAVHIDHHLIEASRIEAEEVFVPGGRYHLRGQDRLTTEKVSLSDYVIDRYEVSNQDYKAFIDAGGYREPAYWKEPMFKDEVAISWEEAMRLFTDRTGLHGPRDWVNQAPPSGEESFPVTGVSWYEASAYAQWAGKRLPTVFEWQRAARPDTIHPYGIVMPWGTMLPRESVENRANFNSDRAVDVTAHPFGVSPYGAYNMAGNAREWCANPRGNEFATAGGSWTDPEYAFAYFGARDGFFASSNLGFRCARTLVETDERQGNIAFPAESPPPVYTPVDERTFQSFLSHFRYDPQPLNAEIRETVETPDWTRQTVTFAGVGGESLIAYLYLPAHAEPPYQAILFSPPFPVIAGWYSIQQEAERSLAPFIKTGRAVLAIVPKGGIERPRDQAFIIPEQGSVLMRSIGVEWANEYSRGVDYLESRDDIDVGRIAHIAFSAGGSGLIFPAVDDRYKSIMLISSGMPEYVEQRLPEINGVNFVPYYAAPTLVLNGRFDEIYSINTHVRPLFNLLPHPKRLEIVESGHVPPLEMSVPIMRGWLDETLGPVDAK